MRHFLAFLGAVLLVAGAPRLCGEDGPAAAAPAGRKFILSGSVVRTVTGSPVTKGRVEVRNPAAEDTFAPILADLGDNGTYRIEIPADRLPEDPGDLTVSILAEGFSIVEKPLPVDPGGGLPTALTVDFELTASTFDAVLDIFACCVLSWSILTVMLPAFLLGAAITAFVPAQQVLRFLGPQAPKPVAYGAAVGSGMVLSLCSCNVVPLFVSIWAGGAGIGPAFAFLYAGPAINLVATVFTCRVIGFGIGMYRVLAVAIISVIVGLVMSVVFGERRAGDGGKTPEMLYMGPGPGTTGLLLGALLVLLVIGSLEMSVGLRALITLPGVSLLAWLSVFRLGREHTAFWMRQTLKLILKVIPILVPSVILIGILAKHVPINVVRPMVRHNGVLQNLGSAAFGSLMYFPILTEVPFVKTLLKVMGMSIGPAMALMLTAPGLSLPGMIIVYREIGIRKLATYVGCIVILATLTGIFFGSEWGAYICSCQVE